MLRMNHGKTTDPDAEMADQKPALRSEAFARARKDAEMRLASDGGLRSLFAEAAKEAASLPRERFAGTWPYLLTMLRLIRAHERGEYKHLPQDDLVWIVTALNYLLDPYDLIPDETPFLGFVDDATIVEFVANKTRQTLDEFMIWETTVG